MAIVNVGGKINLSAPVANLDNKYGPYTSVQAAFDILGPDDLDVLAIGLTVGIQATPTSPIVEYWFKEACDSVEDLVPKQVGCSEGKYTKEFLLEDWQDYGRQYSLTIKASDYMLTDAYISKMEMLEDGEYKTVSIYGGKKLPNENIMIISDIKYPGKILIKGDK